MSKTKKTRGGLLGALLATALLLGTAAPASAAEPVWRLDALANSSAAPGEEFTYYVQLTNTGDANAESGEIVATAQLPPSIWAVSAAVSDPVFGFYPPCTAGDGVGPVSGASSVRCANSTPVPWARESPGGNFQIMEIRAKPRVGAAGPQTASFEVSGGGVAAPASTVATVNVTEATPAFGIAAFDGSVTDEAGNAFTQAGGHPYEAATSIQFETHTDPNVKIGQLYPVKPERDVVADLPPGFLGDPTGIPQCKLSDLAVSFGPEMRPECESESQVGSAVIDVNSVAQLSPGASFPFTSMIGGPIPVFNMEPPPGVPARFGFNVYGTVVVLNAHVRSGGDYGLSVDAKNVSEGLAVHSTSLTFWGVPSDESHLAERACPGDKNPFKGGNTCPSTAPERPFLRNPTSCPANPGEGLTASLHIDSWANPGGYEAGSEPDLSDPAWVSKSFNSHEPPGYPYAPSEWGDEVGTTNCAAVPFEPTFEAKPTTNEADSPTGLKVDIEVPQSCWEEGQFESICQSDLKRAEVTLPQGMSVNPASAGGQGACSASQIGLTSPEGATPIHFTEEPASCPEDSKIGSVSIDTPLLEEAITGSVYLAKQGDNPFKSLLAIYIVAEARGVILKLPGHVEADPSTGQLKTVFDNQPQLPFSHLHVAFFGGQRASLLTPPACGSFATEATMSPWSGNAPTDLGSSFSITKGPDGGACPSHPAAFSPFFQARTQNPLAGSYSPLNLRLTREDGTQRLAGLDTTFPPGLLGKLAGIPYCPDAALGTIPTGDASLGLGAAELASPSCPAASQVGTVTVGAGAGANPFYVQTGKAYLAGPYKGAADSLAIVTPAVAGPFDLGNVLVRTALHVNQTTTQIEAVSDPLPTILDGIPLDLRDLRVNIDRPGFTLNPTSCDPMAVAATIAGSEGASANVSDRFQVGGCERLAFKPKLKLQLSGKTHRSGHPALKATLTLPPGGANPAGSSVILPKTELLENAHIRTVCTRVQFAAHQCPAGSVYGHATAWTPLLAEPLSGPVYLRSNGGERVLPDLVADLQGRIEVVVVGYVDAVHARLRTRFATIPDAPLSKFVLSMQGGRKGLLANNTDICRGKPKASVFFTAHNGKTRDTSVPLNADCGKSGRKR